METIKDYLASFFAGLQDRATNPLTISIVVSWSLWNYKFFLIVFGSETTSTKLALLSEIYSDPKSKALEGLFLYPFLAALAYVFIYPWASRFAIQFYRRQQIITANLIRRTEGERVLSEEDAIKLTRRHEAQRNIWTKARAELEQEVDQLRDALAQAEEKLKSANTSEKIEITPSSRIHTNSDLTTDSEETKDEHHLNEIPNKLLTLFPLLGEGRKISKERYALIAEILIKLSEYYTTLSTETLATNLKKNLSIVLTCLEMMKEFGMISETRHGNADRQWSLTSEGRQLAVFLLEQNDS